MAGLELYLIHGRKRAEESLDDWGTDGPRLQGVQGIHQTYGGGARIVFVDADHAKAAEALTGWEQWDDCVLEMAWHEDLVEVSCDGETTCYGDWGLVPGEGD